MSSRDLSLGLRLYADAARYVTGLTQAESRTRTFVGGAKREFEALKGAMGSLRGQLASLGVGVGAISTIANSARMDKSLTQIGQTAGVSRKEVEALRKNLWQMASETGQSRDDLQKGFGELVAVGLTFGESAASIDPINKTMAISIVTSSQLANALTVAGAAFDFDLSKPGKALELLDKMTVAGGLGSAELDKLPDIFSRVGVNAASAGMGFEKTLAFIEVLSSVEKQPERLATLADSTLRLFNNGNYMQEAASATGVRFFDGKGARRDSLAVFRDIKVEYDKLRTDAERNSFFQKAFGKTDQDTIKGMRTLMNGSMPLEKMGEFVKRISGASGEVERRLPAAIANSVDQAGRLKALLGEAADSFVGPINETLTNVIQWGLDKKEKGGLGLDGNDLLLGGAGVAAGVFGAARYGGKAIGSLAKRLGGTATGVAEGKALQELAGVTPVFVVNWPAAIGGSVVDFAGAAGGGSVAKNAGKVAGRAKTLAVLAGGLPLSAWGTTAAGFGTAAAGVTAAGLAGYGIGRAFDVSGRVDRWIQRKSGGLTDGTEVIGGSIARVLAAFGNEEARRAIEVTEKFKQTEIKGKVFIEVNEGRISSVRASSNNANIPMDLSSGITMMD